MSSCYLHVAALHWPSLPSPFTLCTGRGSLVRCSPWRQGSLTGSPLNIKGFGSQRREGCRGTDKCLREPGWVQSCKTPTSASWEVERLSLSLGQKHSSGAVIQLPNSDFAGVCMFVCVMYNMQVKVSRKRLCLLELCLRRAQRHWSKNNLDAASWARSFSFVYLLPELMMMLLQVTKKVFKLVWCVLNSWSLSLISWLPPGLYMWYMTINRSEIVGTEFAFEALGFAASAISKCYSPIGTHSDNQTRRFVYLAVAGIWFNLHHVGLAQAVGRDQVVGVVRGWEGVENLTAPQHKKFCSFV